MFRRNTLGAYLLTFKRAWVFLLDWTIFEFQELLKPNDLLILNVFYFAINKIHNKKFQT